MNTVREKDGVDVDALFLHPCGEDLAKSIVYTRDKTPDETCAEVIALAQLNS